MSEHNLQSLTELTLELWPDCNYDEELLNRKKIIESVDNYCALAELNKQYIGFVHIAIRNDYVEGTDTDKTAYLEEIYIKPENRNQNIATLLLNKSEHWAKSKGFNQIASDTEFENITSQQFHKKLGFKEVKRIICFLKDI